MHPRHLLPLALAATLAAPAAAAIDLAPVEVTAPPLPREDATAAATVLTPQRERDRLRTLPDALESVAGVTVRRFGGIGAFATVSLRGTAANQVALFLDGIPLEAPLTGSVDLSTLPLAAMQRVEVYRGTSPVALGGQGIGGVVNLVTLSPAHAQTTLSLATASFGTVRAALTHAHPAGGVHLLAHLQALHTEGDFAFDDDNGTPLNSTDDRRHERENNRQDQASLLLKVEGPTPHGRWRATTLAFARENGVPGLAPLTSRDAHLSQGRGLASLSWEGERGPLAGLTARLFGEVERLHFTDREGEVGVGRQDNRATTTSGGVALTWVHAAGHHRLTALLQGRAERYSATNRLADPAASTPESRAVVTAAAEDRMAWLAGRLTVAPTVRYERYRYDFAGQVTFAGSPLTLEERPGAGHLTGKLGVRWEATDTVSLRANLGRYVREPSLSELFGDRGAVVGNPTLAAERGTTWDLGGEWEGAMGGGTWTLAATYFHLDLTDLIQLVQTSQRVARPANAAAATVEGVEVEARARLGHPRATATRTHQRAIDRSGDAFADGRRLPNRPRDEVDLRLEYGGHRLVPFYALHHQAERPLDRANLVAVSARTLHDLGLRWRPRGTAGPSLTVEIDNLTGDATADAAGFPLPGRTLRAGFAWNF